MTYFRHVRFLLFFNPWNWFRKKEYDRGDALRRALEELGPLFVKFGQALSTRPDLLPPDLIDALSLLQDRVPPFDGGLARRIIEKTLGRSIDEVFASFEALPLASASIAQVHAATLPDGSDVVVKVLRPGIEKIIRRDLGLMYAAARLVEACFAESRHFKPVEIVREFEATTLDELDLLREAANASQLKRNFSKSPLLYIPQVYWEYTHKNVMVIERIYGIPIADRVQLESAHMDLKLLATRVIEIFFTQVFRDSFFHADLHPGNIFVSYQHPENPQYLWVDFGIMGALSEEDKRYIAENLHAFFSRNYRRVALLHMESGWLPQNTRIDVFESAMRTVCEPLFGRPLKDISLGQILFRLIQAARRFNIAIQPQLILLQKSLLAVEGLSRRLYPSLDLWATAEPFLERWIKKQADPRVFMQHMQENIPFWMNQLPYLPKLMVDVLAETKKNARENALVLQREVSLKKAKRQAFRRGIAAGLFAVSLGVLLLYKAFEY